MHQPLDPILTPYAGPDDLQTEVFRRDHPHFPARPPLRVVTALGEATTLLGDPSQPGPSAAPSLALPTEILPGMGGDRLPASDHPQASADPPARAPARPARPSLAHHPKFLVILTVLVALTTATSIALAILILRDRARFRPPPPTATSIVLDRADRLLRPLLRHLHAPSPAEEHESSPST